MNDPLLFSLSLILNLVFFGAITYISGVITDVYFEPTPPMSVKQKVWISFLVGSYFTLCYLLDILYHPLF